jgi:hypothetical protein
MVVALVALAALTLTGCGQEQTNGSGPSPTPAAQATPTAVPVTVQSGITPTPGSGNGGLALDIQITQFSVAANFEIRGQFNATNNGTTNIQQLAPTRIQVKRPNGELVFEATAPSIQGGAMDTRPMAGLPPGTSRPFGFSATPGTISKPATEGEEVTGILTLTADGRTLDVPLPTTKVTPIRIP